MKNFFFTVFISAVLLISFCVSLAGKKHNDSEKERTLTGTAQESKAGLVVDGVMITSLSAEEIKRYAGKKVRVKGLVGSKNENIDRYSQGYTMPTLA
ncbi:MAG TPA: hypothetical protein PKK94_21310, partial [Leptospiraceae bacterium]|nr:hypothetical protein [Leptospiraceae bacterium]